MTPLDVIILGGGPAGLSAAMRLHTLGHHVAVVSGDVVRVRRQMETVPRLEVITHAFPGLSLDDTAVVDPQRVGVSHWTGEPRPTLAVCVVERGCATAPGLDTALRCHLAKTEVQMHTAANGSVRLALGDVCQVRAGSLHLTSRFVINATGRHSPFRSGLGLAPWRQVVISGEVSLIGDVPSLWTESLADGWLWAIRDRERGWLVSVFTDPASIQSDPETTWRCMLQSSKLGMYVRSVDLAKLKVQEASPVSAERPFDRNLLHIGDAALARCPLASQGLSAAISDGQSAATALSCLLRELASVDTIQRFLDTRHQQARLRHAKFLASSYAGTPHDTPYWRQRGDAGRLFKSSSSDQPPELDRRVVLSPAWTLQEFPTLTDDRIQLATCLCSEEETLRWIGGHAIAELLSPVARGTQLTLRGLVETWRTQGQVNESTARRLLMWLLERRVLVSG